MSSTSVGRNAESAVAEQLNGQGYKLLDQNWRTRSCEIDLVMQKNDTVYFIEVKFRKSDTFGSGLDYITPKKQKQMLYAAEMWASQNKWDKNMIIAAVETDSLDAEISLIELF